MKKYRTKQIFKSKNYAHLDSKKNIAAIEHKIINPTWIAHHGFLPLIHITLYIKKRQGTKIKREYKHREIFYSSHIDSYIYQYYANKLLDKYELYINENNFQNVPTAYRSIDGKCNIDFAKEAFDFIKEQQSVFIYVTDFHSFFDSLDHKLLKKNIAKVLGTNGLNEDDFVVYKSLCNACYFDLEEIANYKGVTKKSLQRGCEVPDRLLESKEMRELKSKYLKFYKDLIGGNGEKGIPQGTSISAVYANVYMIDFDSKMSNYVNSINGLYRRYSDDIICVVPVEYANELKSFIGKLIKEVDIEISPDKTKSYIFKEKKIIPISENAKNYIEYLGFSFDGKRVLIKDGSINNFYKKLDNRLYLMKIISAKNNKIIGLKKLYNRYTHISLGNMKQIERATGLNVKDIRKSTFLTYVDNAVMKMQEPSIKHQVGKHWSHVCKMLSKIKQDIER